MPDITERFEIDQPPYVVWDYLQDVPAVVTCVPGLELTSAEPPKYRGKIRMRLGPVSAGFEGEATIVHADVVNHHARIEGQGLDRQGGSRANATVEYVLRPKGDAATEVTVKADIKLSGALAQIGRTGIVQDVARELTSAFADNLRQKLAARAARAEAAELVTAPPLEPPHLGEGAAGPTLGGGFLFRFIMRRLGEMVGALFRRLGLKP